MPVDLFTATSLRFPISSLPDIETRWPIGSSACPVILIVRVRSSIPWSLGRDLLEPRVLSRYYSAPVVDDWSMVLNIHHNLLNISLVQGGPAEMPRLCMRINQSISEIYLY